MRYLILFIGMGIWGTSHSTAQKFNNRGAYWAGEGKMIMLTDSLDENPNEMYAVDLSSHVPALLGSFTFANGLTSQFGSSAINFQIFNNTFYLRSAAVFDFSNEIIRTTDSSSGEIVRFSYNPINQTFRQFTRTAENGIIIFESNYVNSNQTTLFASPIAELTEQQNTDRIINAIQISESEIYLELQEFIDFPSFDRYSIVSIDISNPDQPIVSDIRGDLSGSGLLPGIPAEIDGYIVAYEVGNTIMRWEDIRTGDVVREFDTGITWVSHSVNEDTGNYYFHDDSLVLEDPPGSGMFYSETRVIISKNDFTSKTEVVFRVEYPTQTPTAQDYINHLSHVTDPIVGSPFPERKRMSSYIFNDPDRNGDGQIDVADLVMRINEVNSSTSRTETVE
jgi:hypothetical protein